MISLPNRIDEVQFDKSVLVLCHTFLRESDEVGRKYKMVMDSETNTISQKVKRELADFLGIGIEDIEEESEFSADFHMSPTDMTDFIEILSKAGFATDHFDLAQIETFGDLIDEMTAHV